MPTTTNLNTLKINYLTQAQYDAALTNEQINENEIYLTPSLEADSTPIGAVQAYAGSTAPRGWLICDGSAVSRTTYSELFEVIGTTYGSGNGSTTFNLPDLRGRVPIGSGLGTASDATSRTLGQSGGSERVTLSVEQIPSHNHAINTWKNGAHYYNATSGNTLQWWSSAYGSMDANVSSTGGGQSHGNMQPYLAINYIIKAVNVNSTLNKSHITEIVITGTTTSTGALTIPEAHRSKNFISFICTSASSLVYRRDETYLTVMYQGTNDTLVPRANTNVTVVALAIQ